MSSSGGTANSLVGKSGDMPYEMYLKKEEVTCIYNDPYAIENFQRNLLKDRSPDKPFFAYEEARGGVDKYGNARGGFQSTQALNLRHTGFRTPTKPYLKDGTFLDHQFLVKDPRGVALGPDMMKHRDQQENRGKFIKFTYDGDNTVKESGWNPYKAQMQIRNAQTRTKDQLKIFKTGKQAFVSGGMTPYTKGNTIEMHSEDRKKIHGFIDNVNKNNTVFLSNETPIGWRRTTDHEFKIAKYGRDNVGKPFNSSNWYDNRIKSYLDNDMMVSHEGQNVLKSIALTMIDLSRRRNTHQFTGLNGIEFKKSLNTDNNKRKLKTDEIHKILRKVKETKTDSAHTKLNGELKNNSKKMISDNNILGKTNIKTTIVEKMSMASRAVVKHIKDDLRDEIEESATDNGIYKTSNNKQRQLTVDSDAMWNSKANYVKGEVKEVNNYASVKHTDPNYQKNIKHSNSFSKSKELNQRDRKETFKTNDIYTSRIDNETGLELEKTHLIGPLGKKYMVKHTRNDIDHNELNGGIEAKNRR